MKIEIIQFMEERNSPVDVDEIKLYIQGFEDITLIYDILNGSNEFFCLTKKVWYLKSKINLLVEKVIADLMVIGNTNKDNYVAFKDIYNKVRESLGKNNVSMERLSELMEENKKIKHGKNTRWWKINESGITKQKKTSNDEIIENISNSNIGKKTVSKTKIDEVIKQYFDAMKVPVTEEELIEDVYVIVYMDKNRSVQKYEHIKKAIGELLKNSGEYKKADAKRWVPKNFAMYEEYKSNLIEQLNLALSDLEPRHRYIFDARNGIGVKKITYQAIGDELGISKQRVTQIYEKIIANLKRNTRVFKGYGNVLRELIRKNNGLLKRDDLYDNIINLDEFKGMLPDAVVGLFETKIFSWYVKYNNMLDLFYIDSPNIKFLANYVDSEFDTNVLESKIAIIDSNDIIVKNRNLDIKFINYYLNCYPNCIELNDNVFYIKKSSKLTRFDYIYITLYKEKKPMHFELICNRVNDEFKRSYDPRDIQSAILTNNDVFVRTASGTYGFRSWGVKEDIYVKDACYEVLKKSGKPMYYEDIANEVMKIKDIKLKTAYQSLVVDDRIDGLGDGRYALKEWNNK